MKPPISGSYILPVSISPIPVRAAVLSAWGLPLLGVVLVGLVRWLRRRRGHRPDSGAAFIAEAPGTVVAVLRVVAGRPKLAA